MRRAVLMIVLAACGATTGTRKVQGGGVAQREHRERIKPLAAKAFEAAMRAIRVGGPEASETARGRLRDAIKEDPALWEAWYDLGVLAFRDGDDDEAVDDFGKALAHNPGHTATLAARAEANRRTGHKRDARADYENALKAMDQEDPNRRDVAARLASLLRDAGDFDDAVEVLRNTVRVSGTNAKIYTELGQLYIAQKRLELAQLVLAKALEADAKDPAIYNAIAILALRQGRAQDAFGAFDRAAELDPSYLDARFNKAAVLLDAGDYARAKAELEVIVKKNADDYAALVALGVAHRGMGKKEYDQAAKVWERVVKEAPRRSSARADALWNLTLLKTDFMEDTAGGKADLERYLQDAPTDHAKRKDAENKCKEVKCR